MSMRSVRFSVIIPVLWLALALPGAAYAASTAPPSASGPDEGGAAYQGQPDRQTGSVAAPIVPAAPSADPARDTLQGSVDGTAGNTVDGTADGIVGAAPDPPAPLIGSEEGSPRILLADGASPFLDLGPTHPYYAAILYLYDRGIVSGRQVSPGVYAFNANDSVWRAQFAKMIVGAHGIPVSEDMAFDPFIDLGPDIEEPIAGSDNLYPHEYVAAAARYNITRGTSAQYFSPWLQISRAQVITMVVRSIENYVGWAFREPSAAYWQNGFLREFQDPTHGRNVHLAESSGLLDGIDLRTWDPWVPASRGETAQILYNMMVKFPLAAGVQVQADGTGVYPTLEAAVAGVQPGATIHLGPGTFELASPLIIDKPLNLVGQGMDSTFVTSAAEGSVVRFQGTGLHDVEGITFRHEGSLAADAVVVRDTTVNFRGCRFTGGARPADWRGDGLWLEGIAPGVFVTVTECVAEANGRVGIEIKGAGRLTLVDSICRDNTYSGVAFFDATEGSVRGSQCTGNGSHGISVYGTAQPTLENNTCTGNTYSGIAYFDTTAGTARGNQCSDNGSHGIETQDAARPTLENNTCTGNTYSGIAYFDTTAGTARGNQCSDNGSHGINAADSARPALLDNRCNANERNGIHAGGEADVTVEGNVTNGNGESGVSFDGSASGTVRGNGTADNDVHGIAVADTAHADLANNVCANNAEYGIGYLGSATGTAQANECRGNLVGLFVESGADPTLLGNDCHDNVTADVDDQRSP